MPDADPSAARYRKLYAMLTNPASSDGERKQAAAGMAALVKKDPGVAMRAMALDQADATQQSPPPRPPGGPFPGADAVAPVARMLWGSLQQHVQRGVEAAAADVRGTFEGAAQVARAHAKVRAEQSARAAVDRFFDSFADLDEDDDTQDEDD